MKNIKLPIIIQQNIKSYTHYALPLCIIFSEEKYHPWFYKEFSQIKSFKTIARNGDHLDYFLRSDRDHSYCDLYTEIMETEFHPFDSIENINNIVDFIIEKLEKGIYSHIYLDEYHIKAKSEYMKKHFIHPSLIYGFDKEQNIFYAIGFVSDGFFKEFTITFEEIQNAINISEEKLDIQNFWGLYNYKLKPINKKYSFTLQNFMEIILNFIESSQDENNIYGYDIYNLIFDNLKKPFKPNFYLKYNTLHFLAEHKNTFLNTIDYILKDNQLEELYNKIYDKYKDIVNIFTKLRRSFIGYQLDKLGNNPGPDFNTLQDLEGAETFYNKIKKAVNLEKEILLEIYNILKNNNLAFNNFKNNDKYF